MKKVLFACGGTGGHIYPALALADELKKQRPEVKIHFGGRVFGMERDLVEGKYQYHGVDAKPLRRGSIFQNLILPLQLLRAFWQARNVLKREEIDAVIATGGYVTLPYLLMAQWHKIPTYLQEQNMFAGIANKIAAKRAKAVFTPADECQKFFPKATCFPLGNPVRNFPEEELEKPVEYEGYRKVVLAVGGSQGARGVNREIKNLIRSGLLQKDTLVFWQSGPIEHEALWNEFESISNVVLVPFIRGIYPYFAHADLIVSRAGASTLAELALLGKASILIPFPYAAENHQEENAKIIQGRGAGLVFLEGEKNFAQKVDELLKSEEMILKMEENVKTLARPEATQDIVKKFIELEAF